MLLNIITCFTLLIIFMIFIKVDYASLLLLIYINVVPLVFVPIGGVPFVKNYLFFLLIICLIFRKGYHSIFFSYNASAIRYIFYFFIYCSITSLFSWNTEMCLSYIRSDLFSTLLYPLALVVLADNDVSFNIKIKNAFLISICIICGYAILLAPLHGLNPYIDYLRVASGSAFDNEAWTGAEDRLFGRISSTFFHPMIFGNYLVCSFVYTGFVLSKERKKILLIPFILTIIASFICGVRSVLIAEFAVLVIYLYQNKLSLKRIFIVLIIGIIFLAICYAYLPKLLSYLESPFVNDSMMEGSSIEMRLKQFGGIFNEISDCLSIGHGHGWTSYYIAQKGNHPTMLAFESLTLKVGCEYGLIGTILYIFLFYKIFMRKEADPSKNIFCKCATIGFLSYSFVTGDYGYMMNYLIVYTLITIYNKKIQHE